MPAKKLIEVQGDFGDGTLGDEQFAWGLEKMVGWRLAWQRAVAKAWALDSYKARLLNSSTTSDALKEVGWEVPEGLELQIKEATGIDWDENVAKCRIVDRKSGNEISANGWAYQINLKKRTASDRRDAMMQALKTKVTLMLPPEPSKKDAEFAPLALADYDGLSRAYPFTTCCVC